MEHTPLMKMSLRQQLAKSAPYEELIRFDVESKTICGLLCMPDYRVVPCPAVLICHGFSGSRSSTSRLLTWVARSLAHHNIGALVIDFRGSGESEGDFHEMTPETEIADAKAALDILAGDLRINADRLGMIGHSLGGTIAACTTGDDKRVKALALWGAVAESDHIISRLPDVSDNRTKDGWDAGGLEVSEAFRDCAMDMDIQLRYVMSSAPVLVGHGKEDETVPFRHAEIFVENANRRARHFKLLSLKGADHCFNSIPAREELIQGTVDWFTEHLSSVPV